jgi:hypothetical protein
MMPNQISTMFIQDALVGVKCTCTRGLAARPVTYLDALMGGVVVHDEKQLAFGAGPGDLLEEAQELLVSVPGLGPGGDLAGRDLQGCEQCGGSVSFVVAGAAFGQSEPRH